jgi:hypothetical protein
MDATTFVGLVYIEKQILGSLEDPLPSYEMDKASFISQILSKSF